MCIISTSLYNIYYIDMLLNLVLIHLGFSLMFGTSLVIKV